MTETITLNTALLEMVLHLIENQPKKWDQGSWITSDGLTPEQIKDMEEGRYDLCGTTGCVAGWAMLLSGEWKPKIEGEHEFAVITELIRVSDGMSVGEITHDENIDTDAVYKTSAGDLLGLEEWQARHIFLDMGYSAEQPKTFTDKVRAFLGLPVKWGTQLDPNDPDEVLVPAEGEFTDDDE